MTAKQTIKLQDILLGVVVGTVAGLGTYFFTSSVSPDIEKKVEQVQDEIIDLRTGDATLNERIYNIQSTLDEIKSDVKKVLQK